MVKKMGEGNFLEKVSFPQTPILPKLLAVGDWYYVQLAGDGFYNEA
jgi:uncharacterized protein YutD